MGWKRTLAKKLGYNIALRDEMMGMWIQQNSSRDIAYDNKSTQLRLTLKIHWRIKSSLGTCAKTPSTKFANGDDQKNTSIDQIDTMQTTKKLVCIILRVMESVYYDGVLCIHYPSVDPTNIIVISRDDQ